MSTGLFVAGDWGTTHLRLFLCDDARVLDSRIGQGVRALTRSPAEEFSALTADWIAERRVARAVLSGMIGSRNGWIEVPYVPCPASLADVQSHLEHFTFRDVDVAIVPGLSCNSPLGAPDVMRGEETQLFGALRRQPDLALGRHVLALPGTHTKWVEIEDGRIVRFQTALSGELFALLKSHSTLFATGTSPSATMDNASFSRALQSTRAPLLHSLFQVRSRQLLEHQTSSQALGWLSGLLIGADVDAALQRLRPKLVTLVGDPALLERYEEALATREIAASALDGNECALLGLRALAH